MTLRDKMLAVIADTNDSVAEREELVEMIAIALLTRKNLFVLGEPGQAKSYAINLFRRHITGARQFERLLSKQSDEEQLFGRVDLASLLPGSVPPTVLEQDATYQNQRFNLRVLVEGIGSMKDEPATWEKLKSGTEKLELYRAALSALHKSEPTVQTAGKIPEADIVLLDEIFKCNDGVLNSLLTALNERKYTNEGRTYPIPVISFFAASNEIPNFNDPQEKILEALYDRLELKVVTANIEDRGTRLAVLKNKQTGAFGQISATITLEELRQMQQEVASIPVPDVINELADDILCELRKDMAVSDRKYLGYEVDVWDRGAFPKPDLPFPEDTVKVSGIPAVAQHTVFATAQDKDKPLLRCVNLMFTDAGLRAAGSNGMCIVTAKGDDQSTGDISLLVPALSLGKLAGMCKDEDEFRVGTTGKSIVFFKENFLFSARLMEGGYIPLPAPLCLFYATTVQSFSGICFNRHAQAFSQAFAFSDSGHFTNIPSSI